MGDALLGFVITATERPASIMQMGEAARRAGFLLAVLAVILAGCGSEAEQPTPLSPSEYQAAIRDTLQDSRDADSLYLDLVVERRPRERCIELITSFHEEIAALIDRAAALEPPAEVAVIHQDFIAAAEQSVEGVGEAEARVRAGKLRCGDELNDVLYRMPSSEEARRAISRLEEQGFVVFGR